MLVLNKFKTKSHFQVVYHKDRDRGRRNKKKKLFSQGKRPEDVCRGERITLVRQTHSSSSEERGGK